MPISHGFNQDEGIPAMGRWSVKFKASTPPEIRKAAFGSHADDAYGWNRDTIAITPSRIHDPGITRATVLSKAVFSGMIEDIDLASKSEPWALSGPSIMAWLGNGSSPKIGPADFPYTTNTTFASIMVALFATSTDVNGLTLNTAATCSTNTISDDSVDGETALDTIQRYMRQTTTKSEMWVPPDGDVKFAAKGNAAVFTQTPKVMFTRSGPAGYHNGTFVIPGATFSKTRTFRDHATTVKASNPGTWSGSSTWAPTPSRYAFDGTSLWNLSAYYQSSAPATMNEDTALLYDRHRAKTGHYVMSCTVSVPCILSHLKPGDWVYLYDPDTYTYDTSNEVVVGGGLSFPVALRVATVDMPVAPEMGVYRIANCSNDPSANHVDDLSDYVEFESAPTRVVFDTDGFSLQRQFHTFAGANTQTSSWR